MAILEDICIWFPIALGWVLNIIGMCISSPHRMPVLFWISCFAPLIVPLCIYGLVVLVLALNEILKQIGLRRHANANEATATVAALEGHTLQAELREPPNTNGARSFNIASLPTYLYNKEAVEGGLACPICKDLFEKTSVVVQLPLCIHCYHKECIEAWLERNLTCPVCRCRVDMEIPRDIALIIDS